MDKYAIKQIQVAVQLISGCLLMQERRGLSLVELPQGAGWSFMVTYLWGA